MRTEMTLSFKKILIINLKTNEPFSQEMHSKILLLSRGD
jgi:hypothetical protein